MTDTERHIKVKLTADVSEYTAAIRAAIDITHELLACGIDKKDLPAVIATVTKLTK